MKEVKHLSDNLNLRCEGGREVLETAVKLWEFSNMTMKKISEEIFVEEEVSS